MTAQLTRSRNLAQLPLLSVVLAPRIASEAAQAALEALASDDPIVPARRIEAARCGTNWDGGEAAVDVDDVTGSASGAAVDDGQPPDPTRPVTAEQARAAADVALAAAAARAKLMADEQGVEMERLTLQLLKAQLKRVNIKLKYLQQLDQVCIERTWKWVICLYISATPHGRAYKPLPSAMHVTGD